MLYNNIMLWFSVLCQCYKNTAKCVTSPVMTNQIFLPPLQKQSLMCRDAPLPLIDLLVCQINIILTLMAKL